MKNNLEYLATLAIFVTIGSVFGVEVPAPDFTKGDKIPKKAKHDWNLGATGLRGWIYCNKMVTSDARQIAITKVESNSPADGIFAVGDVILGVGGKSFSYDPRTEMGKALTLAESEAGQGKLSLTRWRAGSTAEILVKLPVLGTYSATAPYDCPKSKRILEQGCKDLAKQMADPSYAKRQDPIPRSLNALALLASGDPGYLPLIKKETKWAANYKTEGMATWYYGYIMMFLSEYKIATGDDSVMPGLKRLALEAANGQSAVGSWGHGFAKPDGRLGGYGMMNSPGLPLTISLVMARKAGVKDPALDQAIERSAKLLRFYIGKGAIPYGDHSPWIENHEDNGKCGMAAVLFNLLGESKGAEFFSRMSVASHGSERDTGHTGNFFNILWAMPGVAMSGPQATGAWMSEFGTWYYDLARGANGNFLHQGPPEPEEDSFAGWDSTGGYLLAYAMPLKKLYLTGKKPDAVPQLNAAATQSLILDGRGWNNKDRKSFYDALSEEQLLERLRSWSPVVRERAAMAIGRRKNALVTPLVEMLDSPNIDARYGACQGLIFLRGRGAPAVDALQKTLTHQDLWLRIKAAEALAAIGAPAMKAVPQLLELLAQVDVKNDPRGMQQRYLSFSLFERDGMLGRSLEGIDRPALYKAVRAGLKNEDGRARGSIGSVYRYLSLEEIKPLLPAIHEAIVKPAPSGEMFADGIRVEGLRLLSQHHIEEGTSALVKYTRDQNPWESQIRTPELMKILLTYGTHAKAVIPELIKIADYFEKEEKDFPRKLMLQKAKSVRDTITAIEASTDTPKIIRIKEEKSSK
jgi:HEAT repeat protein